MCAILLREITGQQSHQRNLIPIQQIIVAPVSARDLCCSNDQMKRQDHHASRQLGRLPSSGAGAAIGLGRQGYRRAAKMPNGGNHTPSVAVPERPQAPVDSAAADALVDAGVTGLDCNPPAPTGRATGLPQWNPHSARTLSGEAGQRSGV